MPLLSHEKMQCANLEKKIGVIKSHIYRRICALEPIRYHNADCTGAEHPDYDDRHWHPFVTGQSWGGRDQTNWFRIPLQIPHGPADRKLALIIQPGKRFDFKSSEGGDLREYEIMVYWDGRPLQSVDVRRNEIPIWDMAEYGKNHLIALQAFSGLESHRHVFERADLVAVDVIAEELYFTVKNIYETLLAISESHGEYPRLKRVLEQALLQVDYLQTASPAFFDSLARARDLIHRELGSTRTQQIGLPAVLSLGHSHLDLAWKWQIRHSIKKAVRTCCNALRLQDLYPEYRFTASQAQLYKWMQDYSPDIFNRIKENIRNGQWEATGGMWVESDCNIPAGESLVRQFMFGKRYFRKELECDPQVVWLPDCFGFCYSLPQIIKLCGLRFFVTTKLSWNQFCRFPYDTFYWQGLDGTRILCHFITTPDRRGWNDYSVDLTPANVQGCWDNYHQQQANQEVLLSFGWGDGGGGPTREMLENARCLNVMPGLPFHHQGQVESFFIDLEKRVAGLPVWNDELYLQLHRGVYTSQARIKKHNRDAERLLHNVELLCVLAYLQCGRYPHEEINRIWESVLLNQFHDILPGSAIAEVYQDCEQDYRMVRDSGARIMEQALKNIGVASGPEMTAVTVFNSLSWQRSGIIRLPLEKAGYGCVDGQNRLLHCQAAHDQSEILVSIPEIPAFGFRTLTQSDDPAAISGSSNLQISCHRLENAFFILELDDHGLIASLFDKRHRREIIEKGKKANVFQVFEDRPLANDAWDIDLFYQDKCLELVEMENCQVKENGPIRGGVLTRRRFLSSTITQYIYLYDRLPYIDFVTEVDWQQHQTLLKVAFPLNILSNRATYEIPFGVIERPTHGNTDWDRARFEMAAQKWADLSEGDYGVSLLNDCKYGYDIKDNVMRLTLIKSGIDPDANADQGRHCFSYALYPHQGDWRAGNTMKMAYEYNNPILVFTGALPNNNDPKISDSLVTSRAENVIIETVKKAEDRNGIVVRLYEALNQRGQIELLFCKKLSTAWECNCLEEDIATLSFSRDRILLNFKPYEIKTVYVEFA